jgi:hypothetical protein
VDVPPDDEPTGGTFRSYVGPVVLTRRRRMCNTALFVAWVVALAACLVTGRFDIIWLPVVGMVTSSVLLLRDRAGRRRTG